MNLVRRPKKLTGLSIFKRTVPVFRLQKRNSLQWNGQGLGRSWSDFTEDHFLCPCSWKVAFLLSCFGRAGKSNGRALPRDRYGWGSTSPPHLTHPSRWISTPNNKFYEHNFLIHPPRDTWEISSPVDDFVGLRIRSWAPRDLGGLRSLPFGANTLFMHFAFNSV